MGDLFDGVASVEMAEREGMDAGIGMIAKDGERVPFSTPFIKKDEIENWLAALESKIRDEL